MKTLTVGAGVNGVAMTTIYEIRVKGHLHGKVLERFEGLMVTNQPNGEAVLSGPIADQAALHGVLIRVCDLGLPLISVNRAAADTQR